MKQTVTHTHYTQHLSLTTKRNKTVVNELPLTRVATFNTIKMCTLQRTELCPK